MIVFLVDEEIVYVDEANGESQSNIEVWRLGLKGTPGTTIGA